MEYKDGVIAIIPNGEVIVNYLDEVNPRHWCCFDEIETKLNLNSNCGTDQMEHAWYLARKGIISFQVAKNICYIITSPEVDQISPVQLEKFYEVIDFGFHDVEMFGVDLVSKDSHRPIEIDNCYEYGIDGLNQIFGFDSIKKHKTR